MMRGRPREFDETKAVQAALDVFWRKGYGGASCEELLAAMGLNSRSMYKAFGDKMQLYERALDMYCETVLGRVMQILQGPGTPLENVRSMIGCWGDFMNHPDCKGCFIDNTLIEFGAGKEGVAELARGVLKRLQDALEMKLKEAKRSGELTSATSPKELAIFLVNTKQGLNVMSRANVGEKVIKSVVKTTLAVLV